MLQSDFRARFNAEQVSQMSDEQLCEGYRSGASVCADELFHRYSRAVRSICRFYYLQGADADDLMQEGYLGLFRALREFDPACTVSFHSYAVLCIRRHIYSAIRDAGRKKHAPLNEYISLAEPLLNGASETGFTGQYVSDPEKLVLDKEANVELEQEIAGLLSTLEAKVLTQYLNGYTMHEIAEALGKPYKSVDNAITRIRRKLVAHFHFFSDNR